MYMPEYYEEMDKEENSMFDFESYLIEALNGFDNDPADTDYQRGYEAALREFKAAFDTFTPTKLTLVDAGTTF